MSFKYWLIFNENVEENFDVWFKTLLKYSSKLDHKTILQNIFIEIQSSLLPKDLSQEWKDAVIGTIGNKIWTKEQDDKINNLLKIELAGDKRVIQNVLKSKGLENFNWLSFSIGYMGAKPWFMQEDLDLAIDVTKQRISSGDLPKKEIGEKGWLSIGYLSIKHVNKYLEDQQKISNRKLEKMRKAGVALSEDESLIRLIINKNDIKIYHLPAFFEEDQNPTTEKLYQQITDKDKIIKNRQMLLCKYGKDTKWCTANPSGSYHTYYLENNIYIIHKDNKPIYQFTSCKDKKNHQFMDSEDKSVRKIGIEIFTLLYDNLKDETDCYDLFPTMDLKSTDEQEVIDFVKKLLDKYELSKYFVNLEKQYVYKPFPPIFGVLKIIGLKKFIELVGRQIDNDIINGILYYFIVETRFNDKDYTKLIDVVKKIKEANPNIIFNPKNVSTLILPSALDHEYGSNAARRMVLILGEENLNSIDIKILEKLSGLDGIEIRKPGNESKVMKAIQKKYRSDYTFSSF